MNLNHLAYFRVLGNTEHYTKAANELNITQPSLSHAIHALEDSLGTALFEKQGRNVKLTKYGKFYHQIVDKALSDLEYGENQMRMLTGQKGGRIDLAFNYMLGSNFVPSVIQHFLTKSSNMDISFSLYQGDSNEIIKGLKEEIYDIGFCSYVENEPDITFVKIAQEEFVAIVPLNHPLAKKDEISLLEIEGEPMVYYDTRSSLRQEIDSLYREMNLYPNIICEMLEDTAIAGLVSIGYGIAIVHDTSILSKYPIKKLRIVQPYRQHNIYMATLNNHYVTPSVQRLFNFMQEKNNQ